MRRRRTLAIELAIALIIALVVASCSEGAGPSVSGNGNAEESETTMGQAANELETEQPVASGPVAEPVRHPISSEVIYFVLPDRFANADPTNDTGGVEGGPLDHGYLPTDRAYHHGGDLVGLTQRLDYLEGLGVTAIWITPPFTNKFVQGDGTIEGSSSSYHGYWQINWDEIDPHLGTEAEMQAFIAAAHGKGMKVIFDIVVNHTGDVISYAENSYVYRSLSAVPYLDADGNPFDPAAVAGSEDFPELDAETSFPYTPVVVDGTTKSPEWLNDPTLYHNRGDTTFTGENSLHGDFFGLDDLFTEDPRVVQGMIDIHAEIIRRYNIDGFRIDTVKHVNPEFWAAFAPAIAEAAAAAGKPDFFFFGEVASEDPILTSSFTNLGLTSTLDFIVSGGLDRYVAGSGSADDMANALDKDDWFTDADNNASMQVTFMGNHDEGRMGYLIDRANPSADEAELLERMKLAYSLLFLLRGAPVVYYGDEQGFTGTGGDQWARQSMFPSVTPDYVDDDNVGSDETPGDDNFDIDHPLYRHIAALAGLRREHPTLATGAQYVHEPTETILALSRVDRSDLIEYVILTNSHSSDTIMTQVQVLSTDTTFRSIPVDATADDGFDEVITSDAAGEITVEVPPLSSLVFRAESSIRAPTADPAITILRPDEGTEIATPRYRLEAELADRRWAEVTFAIAIDGGQPEVVGVDDAPPYRVYWNNADLPTGATVEILATVSDSEGRSATDIVNATLGSRE